MKIHPHPSIAVSLGDPAGIGMEVVLNLLSTSWAAGKNFTLFGAYLAVNECIHRLRLPLVVQADKISGDFGQWTFHSVDSNAAWNPGQPDTLSARCAWNSIDAALDWVMSQGCQGLLTCPVHKGHLLKIGFPYPGHTDYIASRAGSQNPVMSYHTEKLKVALVTTHIPIKSIISSLTPERLITTIDIFYKYLKLLDKVSPRVAVAGLNPHSGSDDNIGSEEREIIEPVIEFCCSKGMNIFGPVAPDTVFFKCIQGEFSGVVSLYHDQGSIPVKTFFFDTAVNLTLGLPFFRTSPGHGTAYDIAGKNTASHLPMKKAADLLIALMEQPNESRSDTSS